MFLAFEIRMLLSLPTTVLIAKAIQLRRLDHRHGFTRLSDNRTTLVGNRAMASCSCQKPFITSKIRSNIIGPELFNRKPRHFVPGYYQLVLRDKSHSSIEGLTSLLALMG